MLPYRWLRIIALLLCVYAVVFGIREKSPPPTASTSTTASALYPYMDPHMGQNTAQNTACKQPVVSRLASP